MFVLFFFIILPAIFPRTFRTNIMHCEITVIKYCPVVIFQCVLLLLRARFAEKFQRKKLNKNNSNNNTSYPCLIIYNIITTADSSQRLLLQCCALFLTRRETGMWAQPRCRRYTYQLLLYIYCYVPDTCCTWRGVRNVYLCVCETS